MTHMQYFSMFADIFGLWCLVCYLAKPQPRSSRRRYMFMAAWLPPYLVLPYLSFAIKLDIGASLAVSVTIPVVVCLAMQLIGFRSAWVKTAEPNPNTRI